MRLRELEIKDAPAMLEWMHDKSVVADMNTDFSSKTLEDCVTFIELSQKDEKNLHLAITNDLDEYLGTVSLKHIKDKTAEFGIAIRSIAMGEGYSRKAMDEILNKGFKEFDLQSIYWCVDPVNKRAVRFYEKNGYQRVNVDTLNMIGEGYDKEQIQRFYWYMVTKKEKYVWKYIKEEILNLQVQSSVKRMKIIFCSVMAWGLIAHGFMLFNKFSFHDDSTLLFGRGFLSFLELGRWMYDLLEMMKQTLFTYDYSLTVINGVGFFVFAIAILCILSYLFEIKNKGILIVLSGLMVVLPTITCLFGYIHFAWLYGFALCLSIGGASLICQEKSVSTIVGVIFFACSLGVYQVFFCTGISVLVLYMIKETLEEKYDWKNFFIKGLRFLLLSILALLLYLGILKCCLAVFHVQLSEYKNLDTMGIVSIEEYIGRLKNAYGAFFDPNAFVQDRPYPMSSPWLYNVILFLLMGCAVVVLEDMYKKRKRIAYQLAILFVLFPVAVESIFLLSGDCYSLNFFGHYFIYVLLVLLAEWLYRIHKCQWVLRAILLVLLCLNVVFSKYSNTCYLKANLLCENAKSYFTVLITRIQSVEGYGADLPVVFIEPEKKRELNPIPWEFSGVVTMPYGTSSIINDYAWGTFMYQWTGYNPIVLPQEDFWGLEEVMDMPLYPDNGSICVIDDVVVVKFAEPEH